MDFSDHSLHALEYALGLMDLLPFTLHVLHVEAPLALGDLRALAHSLHFEEERRHRTSRFSGSPEATRSDKISKPREVRSAGRTGGR